jgi:hypothetical protein
MAEGSTRREFPNNLHADALDGAAQRNFCHDRRGSRSHNLLNTMPRASDRLIRKYPPSEPCACEVCLAYCRRPGWWTVKEAQAAINAGLGGRMMLELSPDRRSAIVAPAFRGNEGTYAFVEFANRACTFLARDSRCELHGSGLQPLECRFCHHERRGEGPKCHRDLEKDWHSYAGRSLVARWAATFGVRWPP